MAGIDKTADLAGPGIGDYAELERVLPDDYTPLLSPNETQRALAAVKRHIEDGLCRELGLIRVEQRRQHLEDLFRDEAGDEAATRV